MQLVEVEQSSFNRRFRVELEDGASVEAVHYRGDSLCVSSQVGCAVGCTFCASGAYGLSRPLSEEELWQQLELVRARGLPIKRVTVSGVGEPLHNHRAVADFVVRCRRQQIAPSLTTSGGPVARLIEWFSLPHNGLTLSIHAGTEETRARLVPRGPSLQSLAACLGSELPKQSHSRRKKLALAYLVVRDENESDLEVDAFLATFARFDLTVHLYAYNAVPTSTHRAVPRARYEAIYERMRASGLKVRMSSRARIEENGGCGTLVALKRGALRRGVARAGDANG
jgi:23S rRNA (adenine2503-C2)-methyltransferase